MIQGESRNIVAAVAALLLAVPVQGGIQIWQGPGASPGNNWGSTNNWNGGLIPGVGNTEQVGITTAQGGGPFTGVIVVDVDVPTANQYKSQVPQQDYALDLQGHTLDIVGGEIGRDMSSTWSTWSLVVTDTLNGGGTFDCSGNPYFLRTNRDSDAEVEQATWTFASNVIAVFGSFNPATSINGSDVYPAVGTAVVRDNASLTAAGMTVADNTQLGTTGPGMTGELHVRDRGSVTCSGVMILGGNDTGVQPGKGLGRVRITGKDASLSITGAGFIMENAELIFEIDYLSDDATPPIAVSQKFRIDVSPTIDMELVGVTPARNQVYDLLTYGTWEDNSGSGLTLAAADVGVWELIVNTTEKKIQAKYVAPGAQGTVTLFM